MPEALARVEITSEDIQRYASFGDVPADVRDEARSPDYIPAGVQLDSVRVLAEGGSLLQSTALWFNDSTFRRDLAHADLAVTRTLAMQPPVVVVLPGPQPDGGAIQSWTISEVFVAAHPALYHDFTNNRDADRVERQADALQWFDEEGYFNVVIAWNLSFDEMRKVAESIGPSPTRIRQRTPGRTPTATEGARPEWKGRPILGRPFAHTWSG